MPTLRWWEFSSLCTKLPNSVNLWCASSRSIKARDMKHIVASWRATSAADAGLKDTIERTTANRTAKLRVLLNIPVCPHILRALLNGQLWMGRWAWHQCRSME